MPVFQETSINSSGGNSSGFHLGQDDAGFSTKIHSFRICSFTEIFR